LGDQGHEVNNGKSKNSITKQGFLLKELPGKVESIFEKGQFELE